MNNTHWKCNPTFTIQNSTAFTFSFSLSTFTYFHSAKVHLQENGEEAEDEYSNSSRCRQSSRQSACSCKCSRRLCFESLKENRERDQALFLDTVSWILALSAWSCSDVGLLNASWTIVSLACSLLRAHLAHAVDPFQDPLLMPRYCGSVCCVGLHASFSFRTLSYICSTYHLGYTFPPIAPLPSIWK